MKVYLARTNLANIVHLIIISWFLKGRKEERNLVGFFVEEKVAAQCSKVSRCGKTRKDCSRHAYSFGPAREGIYTHRTDKRFHGQDIMFTTRNAPANALSGRPDVSCCEKLPGRIYERRQIGVQFFSFNRERVKTVVYSSLRATLPRFKRH